MKILDFFKKDKPGPTKLPLPDESISFFEAIKSISEKQWLNSTLATNIYGFQIQANSKWRSGLTDAAIEEFENAIGFPFPVPLKNFYRAMNGLNKPGINIYGSLRTTFRFRPIFYSYPEDLPLIQEMIDWIYEANELSLEKITQDGISRIFPISGHRFMLIDIPGNPMLSMHGNDILFWGENLSKFLANDLINNISNVSDFESSRINSSEIKFWLD